MKRSALLLLVVIVFSARSYCQQSDSAAGDLCFHASEPAKCELQAGVDSYKSAQYDAAVTQFRRALEFDPKMLTAQLYLATALAQQCTPGVDTPANLQVCEEARAGFSAVLNNDAASADNRLTAVKSLASLSFQMKKFDEAKDYDRQTIALDPNDPEAYYSIGVVDWMMSYTARMLARNKMDLKPDQPLDIASCEKLAPEHLPEVEEGMKMLTKAIELRPDYDDAMAYMNLMYRERADYHCGDKAAREADIVQADKWVDQTLAVKKAKMEKARQEAPGNQR